MHTCTHTCCHLTYSWLQGPWIPRRRNLREGLSNFAYIRARYDACRYARMCVYIYIYIYIHTYIHTCKCLSSLGIIHARYCACLNTLLCMCMCVCVCVRARVRACLYVYTCKRASNFPFVGARNYACLFSVYVSMCLCLCLRIYNGLANFSHLFSQILWFCKCIYMCTCPYMRGYVCVYVKFPKFCNQSGQV
jgi:hypothetical protein